jgi:hypothetical protein
VRRPTIWGEGTTACASASKKFGAWDQNLLTEWHVCYRGPGVMIYWSVEKNSVCIYSQLKSCSSSEVAAMIEGVLRHCTSMSVEKNYVDTHGQSEVAFAFCKLLNFELLPRLKGLHAQRLYRPEIGKPEAYPNLQLVLTRPINWELIRQQYDQSAASPAYSVQFVYRTEGTPPTVLFSTAFGAVTLDRVFLLLDPALDAPTAIWASRAGGGWIALTSHHDRGDLRAAVDAAMAARQDWGPPPTPPDQAPPAPPSTTPRSTAPTPATRTPAPPP